MVSAQQLKPIKFIWFKFLVALTPSLGFHFHVNGNFNSLTSQFNARTDSNIYSRFLFLQFFIERQVSLQFDVFHSSTLHILKKFRQRSIYIYSNVQSHIQILFNFKYFHLKQIKQSTFLIYLQFFITFSILNYIITVAFNTYIRSISLLLKQLWVNKQKKGKFKNVLCY